MSDALKPHAAAVRADEQYEMDEDNQQQHGREECFALNMDDLDDLSDADDGAFGGKTMLAIDCEASCASNSSSSSRTRSGVASSSLVLLQYPSSSSSSSSSHSHVNAGNQPRAALALPSLPKDVVRIQTPLLFPVPVVPQHVPRATEIQLFLSRIEYIEINSVIEREENVVYYVLDVFRYRQQNGIPTRRRSSAPPPQQQRGATASGSQSNPSTKQHNQQHNHHRPHELQRSDSSHVREPDYQIEHRYSSFARLRSNVLQIARKRHRRGRACDYCGSLVSFFMDSEAQPSLRVKFTTNTERRKEILSRFINELLFATRDNHVQCVRSLRGYHQVPVLMKRFLNEQSGENFFS